MVSENSTIIKKHIRVNNIELFIIEVELME